MSKIILEGYIVVTDRDLPNVQAELQEHIKLTRKENGCLIFKVSIDKENKNIFNVYEKFINRNAFETHQQRVKNSRWGQVTTNVERHYQISEDD